MKVKEKPCKGQGRAKGFNGCGKMSAHRKYGLCRSCLYLWGRSTKEGKAWYENQFLKQVDRVKKRREKEQRESLKSIARLIQEARVPFQRWIRLRDANNRCISCGANSEIWDAGHYYKAEVFAGLIFNEVNVNKQCAKCNRFLGGNESGYRLGLIERYGPEKIAELDAIADANRVYKFTREELKEIKENYLKKIREWKQVE